MFSVLRIPKPLWPIFLIVIGVIILFANGKLPIATKSELGPTETVIETGKTICVAKDLVMEELLKMAYEEVPMEAKEILDKFKEGEELSECDYIQLYKLLNKKNIKSWVLDESCSVLVCSGI